MNNKTSYFLFQIISFKNYFYVSLGSNFLLFLWKPSSCGGPVTSSRSLQLTASYNFVRVVVGKIVRRQTVQR